MQSFFTILAISILTTSCTHTSERLYPPPIQKMVVLERDWILEKDILVNSYNKSMDTSYSFQVFRRHSSSQSKTIYYGMYPAKNNQMLFKAWSVKKADLDKILNEANFNFSSLLKSPKNILELEKQVAAVGQSLGSVANSKKYGKGPVYQDGAVHLYGDGAGPRISPISTPIEAETRIVAFIESKYKVDSNDIETGRLYFYPAESVQIISYTDDKKVQFREPLFYSKNSNEVSPNIQKKPGSLSESLKAVGADFGSLPHDWRAHLSWSKQP